MNYKQALAESKRVGASKCEGQAHLAMTCFALSLVHAVNPEMLYNGAVNKGLDGRAVRKMSVEDIAGFSFLMFE